MYKAGPLRFQVAAANNVDSGESHGLIAALTNLSEITPPALISISHIIFIIKTGIATLLIILGIWLMVISREKWENLMGSLLGIPDLEISTAGFATVKIFGLLASACGAGLAYFFFA